MAAAAAAAAANNSQWDYIVVTTKALPDVSDDSALIEPLVLGPATCIVLIQNGVGVEAPYRARFPANPIVSAVTVISAEQTAPGTVRQNRWTRIHLGPYSTEEDAVTGPGYYDGTTGALTPAGGSPPATGSSSDPPDSASLRRAGAERAAQLADWWGRLGGIRDAEVADELGLQTVRWHKLCINAAFNPTAVLAGGRTNADMAADPELRAHLVGVMREIWEAAPRVLGRAFPAAGGGGAGELAGPERILRSTERNVGGRPSMLLDWEAGRPMEIEVILGNPVRIARRKGVELPRMQTLYALLKSMQELRDRRRQGGKL